MAYANITIEVKGIELELIAEGYVSSGGSNYYGSDEPAWVEVEDMEVYAADGRKLSKRLEAHIMKEHGDYMAERIIESEW